jgi:hypothetical protein
MPYRQKGQCRKDLLEGDHVLPSWPLDVPVQFDLLSSFHGVGVL